MSGRSRNIAILLLGELWTDTPSRVWCLVRQVQICKVMSSTGRYHDRSGSYVRPLPDIYVQIFMYHSLLELSIQICPPLARFRSLLNISVQISPCLARYWLISDVSVHIWLNLACFRSLQDISVHVWLDTGNYRT